jgi:hypothetical protein
VGIYAVPVADVSPAARRRDRLAPFSMSVGAGVRAVVARSEVLDVSMEQICSK